MHENSGTLRDARTRSTLVAQSLRMDAPARRSIAAMYTGAFSIAVVVGTFVQSTGRWSLLHVFNIGLFASLALVYAAWLRFFPDAFERASIDMR